MYFGKVKTESKKNKVPIRQESVRNVKLLKVMITSKTRQIIVQNLIREHYFPKVMITSVDALRRSSNQNEKTTPDGLTFQDVETSQNRPSKRTTSTLLSSQVTLLSRYPTSLFSVFETSNTDVSDPPYPSP